MRLDFVTAGPEMSIHDLARLLAENISGAPVGGQDGEVLGVVSMTDVVCTLAEPT